MPHPLTTLLLRHRADGTVIETIPAEAVPQTADAAYRVQNEVVAAIGPLGAWKVQPLPDSGQPFASPILASTVYPNGATLRRADFPGIGVEVEVAVTISRDLPAIAGGYSSADLRQAIGSLHVALEILGSRFVDRTQVSALTAIADLQNSGCVVLGPAVSAEVLPEFGAQAMSLNYDGQVIATTPGNATTENVLASLAWLADHAAARGLPLKAGDVVITGARIGALPLTGAVVTGEAAGLGIVSATFS